MRKRAYLAGAAMGFLGVALGAFGAHALEDLLTENGRAGTWDTATHYHIVHALLLLGIGLMAERRSSKWLGMAFWAAFIGIFVFAGSLYLLCITNMTWLGAITPIGGLGFLLAWASIFIHHLKTQTPNT